MTNSVMCLKADGKDVFCVIGNPLPPRPLGETLRYLRPCSCAVCVKFRQRVAKIAAATPAWWSGIFGNHARQANLRMGA